MANNDVLKISPSELAALAARMKEKAKEELKISMADPLPAGGDTGRHRPNPNQPPSTPYLPGKSPHKLLAHENKAGTAHDWREPGHPNLQTPYGPVNPHGRRGTNTWSDGRQRYTPEEQKQIDEHMKEYMRQHDTGADEYDFSKSNQGMTIAGNPSFDIGPGHKPASKKAKGFNKTRNNPNDKEVEMIKKWLGGPQLPDVSGASSRQIRDRLKPFTSGGPADYDKEGGSLRGVPAPLRPILLRDAAA